MNDITITTCHLDNRSAVLSIAGRFWARTLKPVENAVTALLHDEVANVIVDCSGVQLLDSSAIGLLVGLQRRLKASGGTLSLCEVPDAVGDALYVSNVHTVLTIHATLDEAKKAAV